VAKGLHEATTDLETVRAWWQRWPWANIGVATGARSGIVVVDVDQPGGDESLQLVANELGALPETLQAASGGGGLHLVYEHPGAHLPTWEGSAVSSLPSPASTFGRTAGRSSRHRASTSRGEPTDG
jgi:hypothetical protein